MLGFPAVSPGVSRTPVSNLPSAGRITPSQFRGGRDKVQVCSIAKMTLLTVTNMNAAEVLAQISPELWDLISIDEMLHSPVHNGATRPNSSSLQTVF